MKLKNFIFLVLCTSIFAFSYGQNENKPKLNKTNADTLFILSEKIDSLTTLQIPEFDENGIEYKIVKYKFLYIPIAGNAIFFESEYAKLTPQMREMIKKINDDILMFTDIYYQNSKGERVRYKKAIYLKVL